MHTALRWSANLLLGKHFYRLRAICVQADRLGGTQLLLCLNDK
jgi:hypothetical protein